RPDVGSCPLPHAGAAITQKHNNFGGSGADAVASGFGLPQVVGETASRAGVCHGTIISDQFLRFARKWLCVRGRR
ncbi:hypothetical protein, partial [Mycobacterium colombiense]|uniref:hypothetical protein n=1 Tax=Mycobacterium colombiense TaxID=339268 RepID=UPI001E2E3488